MRGTGGRDVKLAGDGGSDQSLAALGEKTTTRLQTLDAVARVMFSFAQSVDDFPLLFQIGSRNTKPPN